MPVKTVPGTSLNYYLIAFDAAGNEREVYGIRASQEVLKVLSIEAITDVFLISHGWLGDIPAAYQQYDKWIAAMAVQKADIERMQQVRSQFRPLLIGLHWPSKPWGDEELRSSGVSFGLEDVVPVERLVEQYASRIANTEPSRQALETIFQAAKEDIAPPTLPTEVRQAYQILNRESSLGSEGEGAAPGADREPFDPERIFQVAEGEPVSDSGISWDGILAPLRTLSFWKMKDRARQFGESGGFKLLGDLQRAAGDNVRFHLMGHSFGCIVVSAMLAGPNGRGSLVRPVNSVALVQGALSHWSYCSDIPVAPGRVGYFRSVVTDRKVDGPIITTQSKFDTAVGKMYPIGAGIRQQIHFAPKLPKYGALGTFGVCGLDPSIVIDMNMLAVDASYQFEPRKIYNLESSKFICDGTGGGLGGAHNDIAKPEVAHAVWQAAIGN
ncbi:hypothetical protein [Aerosakkonema funiforme]|uniref:hypothetical protein n=1 Tax=Aerosakkonema funiforme TaxID=1246630 RepID=UPI0035B6EC5E